MFASALHELHSHQSTGCKKDQLLLWCWYFKFVYTVLLVRCRYKKEAKFSFTTAAYSYFLYLLIYEVPNSTVESF